MKTSSLSGGLTLSILATLVCASAQPNPMQPPPGLVGWWTGDGSAADTASTNHGTLRGNAGFTEGFVGRAFHFDGTDSFVLIAGEGLYGCVEGGLTNVINNFTIEFWAKPSGFRPTTPESAGGISGVGGQPYAIYPSWGGLSAAGAGISVGTNGISVFEHAHGYLPSLLVWDAPVSGWTHVAVVYEGNQPRLLVNGQLARTGVASLQSTVYPSTFLGGSPAAPEYGIYQGLLDEVCIYDRPLSAAEVAAIYGAGSAGKTKPALSLDLPELGGQSLILSWNGGPGIKLQQTPSLANPDWQEVTGSEGASQIELPRTERAAFFRLIKP